jgi:alanyl-tRNA synthetase
VSFDSPEHWKGFVKEIRAALGSGVIAVAFDADPPQIFVTVSPDLLERGISAGELVKVAMKPMAGRGGGRPEIAQGMGTRREGIGAALTAIADTLRTVGT